MFYQARELPVSVLPPVQGEWNIVLFKYFDHPGTVLLQADVLPFGLPDDPVYLYHTGNRELGKSQGTFGLLYKAHGKDAWYGAFIYRKIRQDL